MEFARKQINNLNFNILFYFYLLLCIFSIAYLHIAHTFNNTYTIYINSKFSTHQRTKTIFIFIYFFLLIPNANILNRSQLFMTSQKLMKAARNETCATLRGWAKYKAKNKEHGIYFHPYGKSQIIWHHKMTTTPFLYIPPASTIKYKFLGKYNSQ